MSTKQSHVTFMRYHPQNIAILGREIRHTKENMFIYLPLADNKLDTVVQFFKHPCGNVNVICSNGTCNLVISTIRYGSV